MLKNFFKLNSPFEEWNDSNKFKEALLTSKHFCNIQYSPDKLSLGKVVEIKFENVSFSKTIISKTTFTDCTFIDCLFVGTEFDSVEFHDCKFIECNFNKCKFISVYAKPEQFRKAITKSEFSNVAVHLYQQLRNNYYQGSQREFNQEAEYFFCIWNRKNNFIQAKRKKLKPYKYLPRHIWSWIYGLTLGYGYRVRNLMFTTISIILFLIIENHIYADSLLIHPEKPSVLKTIYFTITTMATLGASGYEPKNDIGYFFVIINVVIGVTIFSASINSIFKKVIR